MAKVFIVSTRDVKGDQDNGRIRTMHSIWEAAGENRFEVNIRSLLEKASYLTLISRLLLRVVFSRPSRRWPLQSVLFDDRKEISRILEEIDREKPTVVYFDTVRCLPIILAVHARFPAMRLVCDFDDLLSRRIQLLQELRCYVALGYLDSFAPKFIKKVIEMPRISQQILRYESQSLTYAEQEIVRATSAVVLVSSVEVAVLRSQLSEALRQRVVLAPAPVAMHAPVALGSGPYRFVFVGRDRQLQNRLAIEYLLDLWEKHQVRQPLYIFGLQSVTIREVEQVYWPGFCRDMEDIYDSNSLLLSPALLRGGVKTKMIEAIGQGCVAIGNEAAFEGIDMPDNPLAVAESEIVDLVQNPERYLERLVDGAKKMQSYCAKYHSNEHHQAIWRKVFDPGETSNFSFHEANNWSATCERR